MGGGRHYYEPLLLLPNEPADAAGPRDTEPSDPKDSQVVMMLQQHQMPLRNMKAPGTAYQHVKWAFTCHSSQKHLGNKHMPVLPSVRYHLALVSAVLLPPFPDSGALKPQDPPHLSEQRASIKSFC